MTGIKITHSVFICGVRFLCYLIVIAPNTGVNDFVLLTVISFVKSPFNVIFNVSFADSVMDVSETRKEL